MATSFIKRNSVWTLQGSVGVSGELSIPKCNDIMVSAIDSSGNNFVNIFRYGSVGFWIIGANKNGDNLVQFVRETYLKFYRSTTGESSTTPTMTVYTR